MPYSMTYSRNSGRKIRRYFDPIRIYHEQGLSGLVREPMEWFWRNRTADKYDLFAEYPFLEKIDYNRLVFETYHGITKRNEELHKQWVKDTGWDHMTYCCWPHGCVLNAAMGVTTHWDWRAAFEKQLPYWETRSNYTK